MNDLLIKKISSIIIDSQETILNSLKKMDEIEKKLLLVFENTKFKSLLSIGDIQRAILKNIPLETPIKNILREKIFGVNIKTGSFDQSFEEIKSEMLIERTECMPVLGKEGNLVDVYFWEEVFGKEKKRDERKLNIPVVVMAGGIGSRLKPLTNVIPKPLIPINEKPIIEEIIIRFHSIGVTQFFLSVNYLSEIIKFYFRNLSGAKYSIEYIEEDKPLGTAGSLKLLQNRIKSTFFVTNCDILINQDYREVFDYHKENNNELSLVASLKSFSIPYGTLKMGENGQLVELNEKPDISYFINAGMYLLEPHLLEEIPVNKFFNITNLIEIIKRRSGKIGIFPVSEGSLTDIGNWKEYINKFI